MDNGIKFGEYHSEKDWDLITTSKEIEKAEPRINEVEIPGRDGALLIPDPSGETKYNNRNISFTFDAIKKYNAWWELDRKITNALHGKKLAVTLDVDPNYYYLANLKVSSSYEKNVGHFTISGIAEPYKYKKDVTIKAYEVSEGSTYTFENEYKSIVPTLELSADMTLEYEGNTYSLSAGSQKVLNIRFKEGTNSIKVVTGSGTLTATYQEASL